MWKQEDSSVSQARHGTGLNDAGLVGWSEESEFEDYLRVQSSVLHQRK